MESQRNLLLIGLLFVSFLIYQQWHIDQTPPPPEQASIQEQTTVAASAENNDVPASSESQISLPEVSAKTIHVVTDVLDVEINTQGGDVIHAELLQYNNELNSEDKFVLLKQDKDFTYIAQSGLTGRDGIDVTVPGRPIYESTADSFSLAEGSDVLEIPLTYSNGSGLTVVKTYVFKRNSYLLEVKYTISNNTDKPLSVKPFGQIKESISENSSNLMMPVYRGGAYSTNEVRYEKYPFEDMQESDLKLNSKGGWVAMLQHYFVTAWLPNAGQDISIFSKVLNEQYAILGYKAKQATEIAQGSEASIQSRVWIGPKLPKQMNAAAEDLGLTSDYGWLWFISKYLYQLLLFFYGLIGNWGLAIICITIVVKGLLYPLTRAQYTSMAKMRLLQPKMQALKERYGDDRQKMSQAMMEMYKNEKVNPLGGCFPILLQMPIFIGLYYALMESVELRHAPFMLWLEDLSVMDPYYILPALMGASMFLIQKMSPTTVTDPMQQKVMTFMPIIFTVFFIWFPSGLVLYWLASNIVTLVQQWLIFRSLEKKGLHTKKSKK